MSTETNKAKVLRFFDEVCNQGNHNIIPDIFSKQVSFNGEKGSYDDVIKYLKDISDSFYQANVEVKEQVAEKDMVSTRRVWTGMQKKEYHGHPSTGKLMKWTEISVVKLVDEKIAEDWMVQSELSEYSQLNDKQKEFLVKDYELKLRYVSDHFQRMWTRFNFFVTIESALIGSKIFFGKEGFTIEVAWIGVVVSFIWYIIGAQDRHLVVQYRKEVDEAGTKAGREILNCDLYTPAGSKPKSNFIFNGLEEWYIERISITRLAAWIPFVLTISWLIYCNSISLSQMKVNI